MADLTNQEKRHLEKILGMSGGYVLWFSNRTFSEFVADSTNREIYDEKYATSGSSKASRLRSFWKQEPNHIVGKLISDMLELVAEHPIDGENSTPYEVSLRTASRLLQGAPVIDAEVIDPKSPEKDFATLAKLIREAIDKNEPESGLDRLHTYTLKYMRVICSSRGIEIEKSKPLHSLIGEYVKKLKDAGEIESEMTERILKSSISTLEAFNRVRNDQSFAHDNEVLNYDESLLILNHVTSAIRFIMAVEKKKVGASPSTASEEIDIDALPF